jgi:hypothetical protein
MKNLQIEKTESGYSLKITQGRLDLLRAAINGHLELELDKETAATLSNALYVPKPKPARARKPKTETSEKKPVKPRAPRKKQAPKIEED